MARIAASDLEALVTDALERSGASRAMASVTAKYLVAADAQGLATHGVARVATYASHLLSGRAKGDAVPRVVRDSGAACLIDADTGLGFGPCELAIANAVQRAQAHGIGFAGVTNSHHCGALGVLIEPVAKLGIVALAFSTAPAAISPWGGKRAVFGTNPVAAVFPRRAAPPLVIDLSLTQVTRGQIMLLQKEGKPIPEGWGMDRDGNPTTDADAILNGGSLHAVGGLKGTMLALAVELICCALTGATLSHQLESLHLAEGSPLRLGQAFIAIAPSSLAGSEIYNERVEQLIDAMLEEEGVRLPGERRQKLAAQAAIEGVPVNDPVLAEIRALASGG
ncbi:MAG: sulfolactate dehydrogenase [Betaproteobacteria bacterium]|nr:sulfolactate dehydrogenase [Betaproteobacteria bacterium]